MEATRITDPDDPRLAPYARLTDRQLRSLVDPSQARVVLESLLVLQVAVRAGLELESVLVDERHLERLEKEVSGLAALGVPVYAASRQVLSVVTGIEVTRGYLAVARRPEARQEEDVIAQARRLVVLEGLVDVTNVGAVFRSAAALGADGVLLSPTCADPLARRAVRVSMGTVFQVPWAVSEDDWPEGTLGRLRSAGFTTVALALGEGSRPIGQVAEELGGGQRVALVFGSEGWGLDGQTISLCDRRAVIPMSRGVDSLNVAASSAVACYAMFS